MSEPGPEPIPEDPHARWIFIRDVLVLQLKLLLGNVHNFILIPATMVAAALDLFVKSDRHGGRFYKVLEWGRELDERIGLYSALDTEEERLKDEYSVDAVMARLEGVIKTEYEKGGTAASMKAAVDGALDQLHKEGEKGASKVRDVTGELVKKITKQD
jgi:hypothetical protein